MPSLELGAPFVRPLGAWIEATPIHILAVVLIGLAISGLFSVRTALL